MADSKYTAPNDFRAFCESLGETEASLCHHGVKGMHWGERKYQDYNGRLTALGRQHYGYGAKKKGAEEEDESDKALKAITDKYNFNTKYTIRDKVVKDAIAISKKWNESRNYDLHAGEKQNRREFIKNEAFENAAIAGAAGLAIGGLTANPLVGLTASGSSLGVNSIVSLSHLAGKNIKAHSANKKLENTIKEISKNTNVDKATGLKKKNSEMSPDQDMAKVNPGFGNWSDNTKNNCFLCSTTYDLRRKGYDVTANGANDGYDATAALAWYPKASLIRLPSPPNFNKTMQNTMIKAFDTPEGGYGNLAVTWKKTNSGHSMIFAVENGQPVLRDCQSNKVYKGSACNKIFKEANELRYVRLDNVQPNINEMKKWGAINPAGQNFKPEQKANTEKAAETATTSGKHGYTGIFNALNKLQEKADRSYAINKVAKDELKRQKRVPNKAYGAEQFGFENDFVISRAAEVNGKLKALYKTNTKTKSGNDVMVVVGADASSNDSNLRDITTHTQSASQIVKNEASVISQAKKAIANAKDDYAQEYYSKSDLQNMAKSLKINRIEVNNGTEHPNVIFEAMSNPKDGYTELFDCSFRTLPNGKVILVDTRTGRDWF